MHRALLLLPIAFSIAMAGCSKGDDANPNYDQKVILSDADKAKAAQNMAGQKAPGAAPGSTNPGTMAMPKGKGGN